MAELAAVKLAAILVVEDQPELIRALRINLQARKYEVRSARTGREALAVAASQPPDAIILDLGLPDIDGTEVIVALREWYRAPIIVLSGRTSPGDKIGALDVGADDYVTKPFAMAELLARLRAALRRDEAKQGEPHQARIDRWLIGVPASSSDRLRSCPASGAGISCSTPTTSGFTWPGCAANWKMTRRAPGTCSPRPAWGTATSPDAPFLRLSAEFRPIGGTSPAEYAAKCEAQG